MNKRRPTFSTLTWSFNSSSYRFMFNSAVDLYSFFSTKPKTCQLCCYARQPTESNLYKYKRSNNYNSNGRPMQHTTSVADEALRLHLQFWNITIQRFLYFFGLHILCGLFNSRLMTNKDVKIVINCNFKIIFKIIQLQKVKVKVKMVYSF